MYSKTFYIPSSGTEDFVNLFVIIIIIIDRLL